MQHRLAPTDVYSAIMWLCRQHHRRLTGQTLQGESLLSRCFVTPCCMQPARPTLLDGAVNGREKTAAPSMRWWSPTPGLLAGLQLFAGLIASCKSGLCGRACNHGCPVPNSEREPAWPGNSNNGVQTGPEPYRCFLRRTTTRSV
jgi:hypothetical protein